MVLPAAPWVSRAKRGRLGRLVLRGAAGAAGGAVQQAGGGWRAIIRDLRDRDRVALDRLAGMAMAHASEAFYSLNDPLEATDDPTLVKIV